MKPISVSYENEEGKTLYLKVVQFLERDGTVLAVCVYRDEIVAIPPTELKVIRHENSDY